MAALLIIAARLVSAAIAAEASGDSARYYAAFNAYHPMGRIASPEEVAGFALVLLSPIAGFMTGAAIAFDGGSTAGRTWGASS